MKTKLFSLFIAVFLFSFSAKAQDYPVITLIGTGNGGWTDTAETEMLTEDGITYTLVDKVLTEGEVKFREGRCWTGDCPSTVGNVYGWGPTEAQYLEDGGWPSGVNAAPVDNGKNIKSEAGSWIITFNRVLGSWSFEPGTPIPVITLVGTAVAGEHEFTTPDGFIYTAKVTLVPGTCQFEINDGTNTIVVGGTTFPSGTATSDTEFIPVTTTGIDYNVTFDYTLGTYTFAVATFPSIALVGSAAGGWPTGAAGEIDDQVMTTSDGITYTLNNVPMIAGGCVFRADNAWNVKYGSPAFPTGTNDGGQDIIVPAGMEGNYNVTLNTATGAYAFTKNTFALVGSAVGGWPTGAEGEVDDQVMTTTDGVIYTLTDIPVIAGGCVFRANNAWNVKYGSPAFPMGTNDGGQDIIVPAGMEGTYNVTLNVITGAYDFTNALSTKNFTIAGLKTYPNPTQNNWNISANEQITSVQVFDILGKSVLNKTFSSNEVSVSATKLSRGVYFAKISTEQGSSTVKLVKE